MKVSDIQYIYFHNFWPLGQRLFSISVRREKVILYFGQQEIGVVISFYCPMWQKYLFFSLWGKPMEIAFFASLTKSIFYFGLEEKHCQELTAFFWPLRLKYFHNFSLWGKTLQGLPFLASVTKIIFLIFYISLYVFRWKIP